MAIAGAIVGRPRLVPADQPTGKLDSHMGDEIMTILRVTRVVALDERPPVAATGRCGSKCGSGQRVTHPDSLFVPFFSTWPGTGAGHVPCRSIAEARGGTLARENRRDGPGCIATRVLSRQPLRGAPCS